MARTSQQLGKVEKRKRRRGEVYVLRYRVRHGGSWIQKTEELRDENGELCKTPTAAKKVAVERMREINCLNDPNGTAENTTVESREPEVITMAEFVKGPRWQDHVIKRVKVSTAYNYDSPLKTYVLPFVGKKSIRDITPSDIAEVMKRREVAGSTPMSMWQGQLLKPKTKRSKRQIHMPEALVDALRVHSLRSRFTAPDDFVFARDDGSPFSQQHVRDYVLSPALLRAGIQPVKGRHGFHLFRHSVASIVYGATKDLKLGQELLGHSTINTTGNIYTHLDSSAREATELLAREIVANCSLIVAYALTNLSSEPLFAVEA